MDAGAQSDGTTWEHASVSVKVAIAFETLNETWGPGTAWKLLRILGGELSSTVPEESTTTEQQVAVSTQEQRRDMPFRCKASCRSTVWYVCTMAGPRTAGVRQAMRVHASACEVSVHILHGSCYAYSVAHCPTLCLRSHHQSNRLCQFQGQERDMSSRCKASCRLKVWYT